MSGFTDENSIIKLTGVEFGYLFSIWKHWAVARPRRSEEEPALSITRKLNDEWARAYKEEFLKKGDNE